MAYTRLSESSSLEEEEASKYDKHRPSPAQLPRNITRLVSYKNLFGTCLGLWIITAVTLAWVLVHGSREQHSSNHAVGSFSFALVPSRIVTFGSNSDFHFTAKDAGESAWMSLMPNDGGIVSIPDPAKHQLPVSYKDRNASNAEVYSMSMFHQLHCLVKNSIRMLLGEFAGLITNSSAGGGQLEPRNIFAPESHVDHCFDYLRQAIMCAGDLSLEHSVVPDEFGFNGWGTAHACADWGAMWELAVEHRYEQQQQQQKKLYCLVVNKHSDRSPQSPTLSIHSAISFTGTMKLATLALPLATLLSVASAGPAPASNLISYPAEHSIAMVKRAHLEARCNVGCPCSWCGMTICCECEC
ncbi:uncharacterized protein SETTUDRAFT_44662 [Exserohilum turcica Et28A]|uniref:Uncharacterized protein n=1 Tax=Exserohilum turcicum (strain 28A) TaxID=671987 RepID=R0I5A9_EXST2|nr:uncharacterized protein SETTUDRAFT_44662 [Exserohilum turcica Et28A]EOA80766.1 hypothetical protein SETTUDRAFT_44662 [Exserohilum turcica Et28A]